MLHVYIFRVRSYQFYFLLYYIILYYIILYYIILYYIILYYIILYYIIYYIILYYYKPDDDPLGREYVRVAYRDIPFCGVLRSVNR